jgi:hypothetical protein
VGTEFGSLSIALSAMQTERQALQVTGQNIANSGTAGYTRQRVDMQAIGGSVQPAMYSKSDGIGDGVGVLTVQRLQDAFLEQQANSANGSLSSLQGSQSTYASLEDAFGEPGTTGLSSSISTFFNSFDDVASNPAGNGTGASGSSGSRTALLGNAQSLADGLNTAANSLASQWSSTQPEPGDRRRHRRGQPAQRSDGPARHPDPLAGELARRDDEGQRQRCYRRPGRRVGSGQRQHGPPAQRAGLERDCALPGDRHSERRGIGGVE